VQHFRSRIRENSGVLGRRRSLTTSATVVFPVFWPFFQGLTPPGYFLAPLRGYDQQGSAFTFARVTTLSASGPVPLVNKIAWLIQLSHIEAQVGS
jgi:hypothetical protein